MSHESLVEEINRLIKCFESLLALYDKNIESMEPFENIRLTSAKMTRLDGYISSPDIPLHHINQIIYSFTPELYLSIERELPQLIASQNFSKADHLFADLKKQVLSIKQLLHPTSKAEAEETMTDEERKVAEMRAAFGR